MHTVSVENLFLDKYYSNFLQLVCASSANYCISNTFRNVYGLISPLFHLPVIKCVLLFVLFINYDKNDKIFYSEIGKHRRC